MSAEALWAWAAQDRAVRLRAIDRDGAPVGVVAYTLHRPGRGVATIDLVATPTGQARRGAGMTAARLVEGEMRAAGISRVYAPAPAVHGIAVYFWIRLGYRPLLRPAWPCERPGAGWMMRDITARTRAERAPARPE
ncbi:MAG: GNAT family N-acetyltransferase [Chloroflexota bacterium]|nr:GNAT family N-acetyltransferase [Chloroflexota bacterium]